MKLKNYIFIQIFLSILVNASSWLQCGQGQYQTLSSTLCQKCDQSCFDCAFVYSTQNQDNFSCLQCSQNYFYNGYEGICQQNCPKSTRKNDLLQYCEPCQIQNCQICDQDLTACQLCLPNFSLVDSQCQLNNAIFNSSQNQINDIPSFINQISCADFIDNSFNQFKNQIQYAFLNENSKYLYIFTPFQVLKYDTETSYLVSQNAFTTNGFLRDCGFYPPDQINFYCTIRPNFLVQYDRNLLNSTLITTFSGVFAGYGGWQQTTYYGRLYQIYDSGYIDTFLLGGIELYSFEQKKKLSFMIKSITMQNYFNLKDYQGYIMFDQSKDSVYFKQNEQTEYLFLKGQTGYLYNVAVLNSNYFLIMHRYGSNVCNSQNLFKTTSISLATDCYLQSTPQMLIKYSFPSINTNFKQDSLLVIHQNTYGTFLIYDYSKGPTNVQLVYSAFNTTVHYKYIGNRNFILLNFNGQLSQLAISNDGKATEKLSPVITQHIFYLSFLFEVYSNKILIINQKQSIFVNFNKGGSSPVEQIPYGNVQQFINQSYDYQSIQPLFGDEQVTNFDFVVKIYYDSNLNLYIMLKNYQIRLKYKSKSVNEDSEFFLDIELNSGRLIESFYIESSQLLVFVTLTEQYIIKIPSLVISRRDKLSLISERQNIYVRGTSVITCALEANNYFQYITIDLSQNTSYVSNVYMLISDYFVGQDKIAILKSADFQIITLSTNTVIKGSPGFAMTFTSNIFFETALTSYLAIFQAGTIPNILLYNTASSSFSTPEQKIAYPNIKFTSQMFDYYQNVLSLYTVQSDGIYTYELDASNNFIQKSYFKNTLIKTIKVQSKLRGGYQSFSKVLIYQPQQGVIVIDKVKKNFYQINSSLSISSVILLGNKLLQEEILVIQSLSQSIIYQLNNDQYKLITPIQQSCLNLRYLDTTEITCHLPFRNETILVPIKAYNLYMKNYPTPINNVAWDHKNQKIITTFQASAFDLIDFNFISEQVLFNQSQQSGTVEYIYYDQNLSIVLYSTNQNALYAQKIGNTNPVLLLDQSSLITWSYVAQDKQVIILNLQGMIYSINYITNTVLFTDDLTKRLINFPAEIISYDRFGDYIYLYVDKTKVLRVSFTQGVSNVVNLTSKEIFINLKRIDGQMIVLTNNQISVYDSVLFNSITTKPFTSLTDSFKIIEISKKYIFCQPSTVLQGYVIDINTLNIYTITFKTTFYALDFDIKNSKICILSIDNVLVISDIFNPSIPSSSFILQEFQDDIQSTTSIKAMLKISIDLDYAIVVSSTSIYIYSLSKQILLYIIRINSSSPLINFWIINCNIILSYDQTAIYMHDLHQILKLQSRFNSQKFSLKDILIYENVSSGLTQSLVENVFTKQLKNFQFSNGQQINQYQIRKTYLQPSTINNQLSNQIISSTKKIIIQQSVIYILDPLNNQIIDSMSISPFNGIATLTSYLLNNENLFYLITQDYQVIQINLAQKTLQQLQVQLSSILFIAESINVSLIFQYSNIDNQNQLMCFNKNSLNFIDMTGALNSFNLQKIIKSSQKINDSQLIVSTQDGYLYYLNFNGCQFQGSPTQLLSTSITSYFYDQYLQRLLVQRQGRIEFEILQNAQLLQTQIKVPYIKNTKIKISDDQQYYILFSDLFVSIYYSADLKLKSQVIQVFSQSEIRDVFIFQSDYLLVITNTDIFLYHIFQDKVNQSFTYSAEMPNLLSSSIRYDPQNSNVVTFIDVYFYSQQGFLKFNIPIFQDYQQINKQCFYSLNLNSQNLPNIPAISDKINVLSYLNQKNRVKQQLSTIVFTVGTMETLQKISTIPQQLSNLVIDSNQQQAQSSIIVDQYFNNINSVSQNIYLRNSILVFEDIDETKIQNPNIQIFGKNIIYLQNILLQGILKNYYFTFTSNSFVGIQNLVIDGFTFGSQQLNKATAFFNFLNTKVVNIQTLTIKNLELHDNLILFYFENSSQITIQSLVIQNINCQNLVLFSTKKSQDLDISKISFQGINCNQLSLIQGQLINNISLQDISYSDIIQKQSQFSIDIQSVKQISINNLRITKCTGLKILSVQKYTQDSIIYTVNDVIINNLSIQIYSEKQPLLSKRSLQTNTNSNNSELISIIDCQTLSINNFNLEGIVLYSNSLMLFNSDTISLKNLNFNSIVLDSKYLSLIILNGNSLTISSLILSSTQNLIIMISNCQIIDLDNISITSNILNSLLSINGIFNLQNIQQVTIKDSLFENNTITKPSKGVVNILNVDAFNIINSDFNKNIANQSGGTSLYIVNSQINNIDLIQNNISNIQQCRFKQNESIQEQGGAIYILEQNVQISESLFQDNKALIGGAIKVNSLNVLPQFFKDIIQRQQTDNQFINNSADLYGKNIGYFPQKAQALLPNQQLFEANDFIKINNFKSNSYIDNLKLVILDNENIPIRFPQDSLSLSNDIIQQEFLKYQFVIEQKNDNNIFVSQSSIIQNQNQHLFNATLIMPPNSSSKLNIKSTGTIPTIVVNSTGFFIVQKFMVVTLEINSIGCQLGDYFSKISQITYCLPCPFGQYSLDIPEQDKDQVSCQNCPSQALRCEGSIIQLRNGYWREDTMTDKIFTCNLQASSCKAEDINSRNTCGKGYIGPLCETCDSQGALWDEKYTLDSNNVCSVCKSQTIQIIGMIGLMIITATYIISIILQNIRCSNKKILRFYTEKIIGISLGCSIDFSRNSILIKILMNFFQIYMILDGSGFTLPNQTNAAFIFGDPTVNLISSIDCLMNTTNLKKLIITRILLKLFFAGILFSLCILAIYATYFLDKSKSKKLKYTMLYANMILKVMFIYGGFGVVTDAVKSLTCVTIGSKSYRLIDKRIECSSDISKDYGIYFLGIPLVIVISIIIPMYLLYRILKITKEKQTGSIYVIKQYNFLIQEYKPRAAYWEIVKIMLKYCIIFVINFFEQDYYAKLLLAVLFLAFYNIFLVRIQPYKDKTFNNFDLLSIFTCQISLICTACILSTSKTYIQNILFTVTVLMNVVFVMGMAFQFMKGIRIRVDQKTNHPLKLILKRCLLKLQPYLQFKVISTKKQFRAIQLWMRLKRRILGFEGQQFIESLQKKVKDNIHEKINTKINLKLSKNTPFKLDSQFTSSQISQSQNQVAKQYSMFDQEFVKFKQYSESISPMLNSCKAEQEQLKQLVDQGYPSHNDVIKNVSISDSIQKNLKLYAPNSIFSNRSNFVLLGTQKTELDDDQCQVTNHETESLKIYQSSIKPKGKGIFETDQKTHRSTDSNSNSPVQ